MRGEPCLTGKEPRHQPHVGDGAQWQPLRGEAPGSGRPCPKVFYPHLLEQLALGGRQMVLDPPSVAV